MMGEKFEKRVSEWLDIAKGDDAQRDGPPSFGDFWHAQNEAFPEETDWDGWPQVDAGGSWSEFFKQPNGIVRISRSRTSSFDSGSDTDNEDSSLNRDKAMSTPRQLIVMRVKRQQREVRDDLEEPRGRNGAVLDANGTVLTLANAASASIYASPSLAVKTLPSTANSNEASQKRYKRLPRLLCTSGRRRPKETGGFPASSIRSNNDFRHIGKPTISESAETGSQLPAYARQAPTAVNRLCFDDVSRNAESNDLSTVRRQPSRSRSLPSPSERFHETTLPKNTLDFFCRDSSLVSTPEAMRQRSLLNLNQSEDDTASSSSYEEADDDTLSVSSLPNGVADCKVAKTFFLRDIQEESEEEEIKKYEICQSEEPRLQTLIPRQEGHVDGKRAEQILSNLLVEDCPFERTSRTATKPRFSHSRPSGREIANRQKWLQEAFQCKDGRNLQGVRTNLTTHKATPPELVSTSPLSDAITKFGGQAPRKSRVQRRKEELERKAAAVRKNESAPSLKIKWEVCNGSYRKKVVLA